MFSFGDLGSTLPYNALHVPLHHENKHKTTVLIHQGCIKTSAELATFNNVQISLCLISETFMQCANKWTQMMNQLQCVKSSASLPAPHLHIIYMKHAPIHADVSVESQ